MTAALILAALLVLALAFAAYIGATLSRNIQSLHNHQHEMASMAEQMVALRKQVKGVLRTANQAAAENKRNADRQYRQQKKVDLILYEDQIRRERLQAARERGELNG
jgi:uncharacterized protein YoxC